MRITTEEMVTAFREVAKVREAIRLYCLGSDSARLSMDDLTTAVHQCYGIRMEALEIKPRNNSVRGLVITLPNGEAKVLIARDLPKDDQRYVFAKEAGQIMIANADNLTDTPSGIIEFYTQDDSSLPDDEETGQDIRSEELAKFIAVELLFPRELRAAAVDRVAKGEETHLKLADSMEMPDYLVEFVLSDRYRRAADAVWDQVDQAGDRVVKMLRPAAG